ncbi:MAG: Gfo/Idh/MocA family oxidoreductase [Candidatus Aminicenantes bacterium]|nr:Gfo/Idh/MocA family oxidoreductase [Candidatus Aminicenantes bacterium]NIM84213.1 Gfo/Idh/MocA family oxidoreductase [Candidatus Aminicenantes bacterium]NIN23662.1 Gfo/Idh/MocA family oxidoreductase [Candidatus Aminicenantes bacterium]NIN47369.1 Gfo/Idh/MocA family oxidoreductase [Candidatus Aminicenantes bacterium]NIN90297.1 Gfo/Idh/MocA family oxidoreductase [Candidatus Aminicenantes bacterium]
MDQLTQDLKKGNMQILEVPFPALGKGQVLVRNFYSVISAGTEAKTVSDARKGYIAKARARQKEVKQVIELVKTTGLAETYKLVMTKLEAPSALGYSSAGEVIGIGEGVTQFKVGDRAACGGTSAVHADVVSVPENLCTKVPEGVELKHAAFSAIAAIAVQGIRQADLQLGESCVVIGLGLIGQITIQLLKAAGITSIGIDIKEEQVQLARENGAEFAFNRNREDIENVILHHTHGYGADAVIITASSSSTDPMELAGALCRQKGKVVIVGGVPTGFSRTNYYKKELDVRMSCSYGPGRYDPQYEEHGHDYPIGYVRWTENRNMQAYIDLLAKNKLNMDALISHVFDLTDAPDAYRMILERSEPFCGILIRYDIEKELKSKVILKEKSFPAAEPNVGLIGAGSFAKNVLLPGMKGLCNLVGVAAAHGNNARYAADKYGFNYCTDKADEIIEDENINTVFIATRHNLHVEFVIKALKKGKNVFVEKPLALTPDELEEIHGVYQSIAKPGNLTPRLMVGFNRRFSPHMLKVKSLFLPQQPKAMNFRVNAGSLPKDHWVHDPEIGGGRIIGEVCHFIDLAVYIAGSKITSIYADTLKEPGNLMDTLVINLAFENGSIASISYFSNGSKRVAKEYFEIYCNGQTVIIHDFKTMEIYGKSLSRMKLRTQDKGHKEELVRFFHSIKNGTPSPIPYEEMYSTTLTTFKILESIKQGQVLSAS